MLSSLQIGLRWSSNVSGGAERVYADLASSLPAAGVSFTGAVAGESTLNVNTSGLIHAFASENDPTHVRMLGARRVVGHLLDTEKPDLLASHFAMYTAPILTRLREQPFVMHFHGPWALESQVEGGSGFSVSLKYMLEKAVYKRANRCIVLSCAFADLLQEKYDIDPEKICVIPGAVDLDRFEPRVTRIEAREELGWPTDRPTLFSLRRLVQRMGLNHLIEAIAEVRKRIPEVLLFIGGTGPMRKSLEAQVDSLGLRGSVRFLGFVPDESLAICYRAAEISVVPTASLEGFGLVAAESLASGTPAMVTPVGGLPEVVRALSEDLVFRSGDTRDLADGLVCALSGIMSIPSDEACRQYAVKNFSRDLMAERTAAAYHEIAVGYMPYVPDRLNPLRARTG